MSDEATPFSIENVLAAIQATSASLTEASEKITSLEATNYRLQEENEELRAELSERIERVKATKADLATATQKADLAEATAAANLNRTKHLQHELVAANDDIASISTAVSGLLQNELRR